MSGWPSLRLGQCCEIVSGATPSTAIPDYWDGDVNWATPKDLSNLEGPLIAATPRRITKSGLASCGASILPVGSVLFSSRAPIGHVAINSVPMATNQGFKSMVPDKRVLEAPYLFHWLKAHRLYLESLGNGATFKEVSKAVVARVEVPVPSIPEQRRIAAILDEADVLRVKRRAALSHLDEMAQAIFVGMFGDPATNPKGWLVREAREIGRVVTGNTPSRAVAENYGSAIEWIKSDNLGTSSYYATRADEHLSAAGMKLGRTAPAGTVLVTCIAGSPSVIGNTAMLDREAAFNQQINALIPTEVNPHFAYAHLKVGKSLVQAESTASMKGMVSKSRFERIPFMVPPRPMQDDFADQVLCLLDLRCKAVAAQAAAEALFASLQHRAFTGEL